MHLLYEHEGKEKIHKQVSMLWETIIHLVWTHIYPEEDFPISKDSMETIFLPNFMEIKSNEAPPQEDES